MLDFNEVKRLWGEHAGRLLLVMRSHGDLAEEAVQEAFAALVRQQTIPLQPMPWLIRVARNHVNQRHRWQEREQTRREKADVKWFEDSNDAQRLMATEAAEALQFIAPDVAEKVTMHLWAEMSFAEIATATGLSRSVAHRRYMQEIAQLRERFSITESSHPLGVSAVKMQDARLARLQQFRAIARINQVDVYKSIELQAFDTAADKLAAGFRLAEFANRTDGTLVGRLVSVAIAGIMLGCMSEMQQQADAPNLYWALATLPDSLWNRKSAVHGEIAAMNALMGSILEPIHEDATNREIEQRLVTAARAFLTPDGTNGSSEDPDRETLARLLAGAAVLLATNRGRVDLATWVWSWRESRFTRVYLARWIAS